MNQDQLRTLQAPLKQQYRDTPSSARITLAASAELGEGLSCNVETGRALVEAGLHPGTGGSGAEACSGDMLLQALVACAGVTLSAVATSMGITLRSGHLRAEGELDFRGTLGVAKDAPVGFESIRLSITIDTDASAEQQARLIELTERYCVVYQTLRNTPRLEVVRRYFRLELSDVGRPVQHDPCGSFTFSRCCIALEPTRHSPWATRNPSTSR